MTGTILKLYYNIQSTYIQTTAQVVGWQGTATLIANGHIIRIHNYKTICNIHQTTSCFIRSRVFCTQYTDQNVTHIIMLLYIYLCIISLTLVAGIRVHEYTT